MENPNSPANEAKNMVGYHFFKKINSFKSGETLKFRSKVADYSKDISNLLFRVKVANKRLST